MRFAYAFVTLAFAACSSTPVVSCSPACAEGYQCQDGVCVPGEPPDASAGDGSTAACKPACGGLTPYCNGAGHCVGCTMDAQCPTGKYCKVQDDAHATCVIGCMSDDRCGGGKCCNMQCTDTNGDANNCGACGKACAGAHAQSTCVNGQCAAGACDPGWGDCDGNAGNGCEANLHVDPMNCTACGMGCALKNAVNGGACADGCYIGACNFGFDDCNGDGSDGCETPTLSDPNNCGGCGASCKGLPNAMANCTAGNCVLGNCNPNFANCDGDPANGCEVGLLFDKKNCGKCGNVCPMQTPYCNNGTCGNIGNKVAVLYAASQNYGQDVQQKLQATMSFSAVDVINVSGSTPTLAQLQPYDAILVFSDSGFQNASGLGDVVESYFDQGGRVVIATFANASVPITGAWSTQNHQLIQPSGQEEPNDSLGMVAEPNSPLMAGVTTLSATAAFRSTGGAINGGTVVAAWKSGKPLIVRGVINNRNVVSLNFYPPSAGQTTGRQDFWMGDGAQIMRNALLFQ